jgi:radical SAM superfamily enzyme YgiQ (UPF0313 family)
MSWKIKENLKAVLAGEDGAIRKDPGGNATVALVYPNFYEVGMANLAVHSLYGLMGANTHIACERVFLPTPPDLREHLRSRTPILSLESQRPLAEFDIIAFTASFENDYLNIIPILNASGLSHRAAQRRQTDPLVIAGGAGPTLNPLPILDIVDAAVLGEVEAHGELMGIIASGASKEQMLEALRSIRGIVTHDAAENAMDAMRRHVQDLNAHRTQTVIHYGKGSFADMHLIEVERGCPRNCRFCATPAIYGTPRRRSAKAVLSMVEGALSKRRKMGLIGADILSHPEFKEIAEAIHAQGATFSPSSVRADAIDEEKAALLAASGHRSIALGIEAGSQKLRASLGKGISDARIIQAVGTLAENSITSLRLYFMVGLPGETVEDIEAIAAMARRIYAEIEAHAPRTRRTASVSITATTFVPKPLTPLAQAPFAGEREIKEKIKQLRRAVGKEKGIELRTDSYLAARIEHLIAGGGTDVLSFLESAQNFGSLRQALKACAGSNVGD